MDQVSTAHDMIHQGNPTDEISKALSSFQSQISSIPKTRTAEGTKYSYDYADLATILDHIREPLADNGLSITQSIGSDGTYIACTTTLLHTSGQTLISDVLLLPAGATAQEAGSAITYARRYSLSAMLCLATEDDDDGAGAGTVHGTGKAKSKTKTDPLATQGQIKAIWAIARAVGFDDERLYAQLAKEFGEGAHPDTLTKDQASRTIEALKVLEAKAKQKKGETDGSQD